MVRRPRPAGALGGAVALAFVVGAGLEGAGLGGVVAGGLAIHGVDAAPVPHPDGWWLAAIVAALLIVRSGRAAAASSRGIGAGFGARPLVAPHRVATTVLLVAACAVGGGRSATVRAAADDDGLSPWAPQGQLVRIRGVVLSDPVRRRPAGPLAEFVRRPARWRTLVRVGSVADESGEWRSRRGRVVLLASDPAGLRAGEVVECRGRLAALESARNPGGFDAARWARRHDIAAILMLDACTPHPSPTASEGRTVRHGDRVVDAWVATALRWRGAWRRAGREALLRDMPAPGSAERTALLRAMFLGDRAEDLPAVMESFRRTGLAHLVVISGFNLALLAAAAMTAARLLRRSRRVESALVLLLTATYLVVAESDVPVVRAAVVVCVGAVGAIIGRAWAPLGILGLAAIAIVGVDPAQALDAGFQLSFAAVAALVVLAAPMQRRWFGPADRAVSTVPAIAVEWWRRAASAALAAWTVSMPIALTHFGAVATWGAPLTVALAPLAGAVLIVGYLKMLCTPWCPPLGSGLGVALAVLADLLLGAVDLASALPWATIVRPRPPALWAALAIGATGVALLSRSARTRGAAARAMVILVAAAVAPPEGHLPWSRDRDSMSGVVAMLDSNRTHRRHGAIPGDRAPAAAIRLDVLDVGDGTCMLIRSGSITAIFDAGSAGRPAIAQRTILPALRELGVRRIDVLVVSHPDFDHVAGVPDLMSSLPVRELIVTPRFRRGARRSRDGPEAAILDEASAQETAVSFGHRGVRRRFGPMRWSWLHPPFEDDAAATDNDRSQVIRIETGAASILLCGDIETASMARLLQHPGALRADVLELPHHGSWRAIGPSFVAAVGPRLVVQSSGPQRLAPDRWRRVLRAIPRVVTARDGAVTVRLASTGSIQVRTAHGLLSAAPTIHYPPRVRLLAESWVHTLDPFALQFTESIGVRWYGLAYLAGFLIGWLLVRWLAVTKRSLVTPDRVGDFVTALVLGVLIGGRVGHVLFYDQQLLWEFSSTPPFWGLLAIHKGGMSSHGGIIGVLLACAWLSRRSAVPWLHLLDLAAFACPIGLGLGRVANLVNGELWGRPVDPDRWATPPWWSIKYPEEVLHEAFPRRAELEPLRTLVDPEQPFPRSLYDAAYAGRENVIDRLAPLLTPHYPSQLFQAFTDGVVLMALLVVVWWRPRKTGVVAAWFVIGYGALRTLTEQYRMPDEGVVAIGPITLPMLLSMGMVAAGVAMLVAVSRRAGAPILGLGPRRIPAPASAGASD